MEIEESMMKPEYHQGEEALEHFGYNSRALSRP